MRRHYTNLTDTQTSQSLELLKNHNCLDYEQLIDQPNTLDEVLTALEQVKIINEKFLTQPWTTNELLQEMSNEYSDLENYIVNYGCEDLLYNLTTMELFKISNTLHYCLERGFDASEELWTVEKLQNFFTKYENELRHVQENLGLNLGENEVIGWKELESLDERLSKFDGTNGWTIADLINAEKCHIFCIRF